MYFIALDDDQTPKIGIEWVGSKPIESEDIGNGSDRLFMTEYNHQNVEQCGSFFKHLNWTGILKIAKANRSNNMSSKPILQEVKLWVINKGVNIDNPDKNIPRTVLVYVQHNKTCQRSSGGANFRDYLVQIGAKTLSTLYLFINYNCYIIIILIIFLFYLLYLL